jgi:hypothetical protein
VNLLKLVLAYGVAPDGLATNFLHPAIIVWWRNGRAEEPSSHPPVEGPRSHDGSSGSRGAGSRGAGSREAGGCDVRTGQPRTCSATVESAGPLSHLTAQSRLREARPTREISDHGYGPAEVDEGGNSARSWRLNATSNGSPEAAGVWLASNGSVASTSIPQSVPWEFQQA